MLVVVDQNSEAGFSSRPLAQGRLQMPHLEVDEGRRRREAPAPPPPAPAVEDDLSGLVHLQPVIFHPKKPASGSVSRKLEQDRCMVQGGGSQARSRSLQSKESRQH